MSDVPKIVRLDNGRPHHVGACFQRAVRELSHPHRFVDVGALIPEPPCR